MYGKDFVAELAERMTPQTKEIDGLAYVITTGGAKLISQQRLDVLHMFSLAPFVAAIISAKMRPDFHFIVNVEDYNRVVAYDSVYLKDGTMQKVFVADFSETVERFSSNTRYSQEDFITRLQSMFKMNWEREELLKLVGSVKNEAENISTDDGVTQNVQVKAGIHLSKEVKIKNPWELLPYKTFPEIEPVEVPYVLRVTKGGRDNTEFALYESDGCRWKIKTAAAVREYLKANLNASNVTVL